jgi:hypothetical protein
VFDGFMPFPAPAAGRRMFSEMLKLNDGQVRFFGLVCLLAGALLLWVA